MHYCIVKNVEGVELVGKGYVGEEFLCSYMLCSLVKQLISDVTDNYFCLITHYYAYKLPHKAMPNCNR